MMNKPVLVIMAAGMGSRYGGLKQIDTVDDENDKIIDIQVSTPETTLKIKKLFLIDYENVADAGVVGVDTLTADDTVIIFYGSKIKSVAYESLIAITSSAASIEHLKAEKTAKNYLDFQLTTYLGYKLGKEYFDEICVVSKDSGFDAVVDFWMEKGYSIIVMAIDLKENIKIIKEKEKELNIIKMVRKKMVEK